MSLEQSSGVRSYLETVVMASAMCGGQTPDGIYRSVEEFVLCHGNRYTIKPLPDGYRRGKMGHCFQNALEMSHAFPELAYCEGYADSGIIPTLHAWVCDAEGNAYDPTWPGGCEYFGVPIKPGYLLETVINCGTYGVLDKAENRFALLRGRHDPEDVVLSGYLPDYDPDKSLAENSYQGRGRFDALFHLREGKSQFGCHAA